MDTRFKKGHIPWNKKEHILKVCPQCGKKFDVRPSLSRIVCCSRSCAKKGTKPRLGCKPNKETREKMRLAKLGIRGKDHWNWKDGGIKRKERHLEMGREEYVLWRSAIFIRDDYTCQICGIRGSYMEADHIKPWSMYPELRYAINNGRTLCRECHEKTDSWGARCIKLSVER